ncbi:4-hydroxybenzoate polyprenyltransferase [Venustampulla echinocandica]|uniref:4-hydroxybenzoate polyprenyltransferase n=1 Tax=Venustampulla echinocandica TaxID=2656787 RepID=A0A370TDU3_9HELO|nr:4-hydroxybenzoate polyprenyltransferase [Venustampulla echinocandica]RDL32635.1 4-hydroxybenzoate polyprenyltransferase [Venustampulla echinocandica]
MMDKKTRGDHAPIVPQTQTLTKDSKRNVARGIFELGRLHTKEAWLCWYPAVWGACLSAGTQNISLDVFTFARILLGILTSVTASHAALCTFNDICDRNFDKDVERCKTRPLPAGMLTTMEAILAYIAWIPATVAITYFTLGGVGVKTFTPIWILSMIYPFGKRYIQFPQIVLGCVIGGAVFPGWAVITNSLDGLEGAAPLFAAVFCWVVYFDVFYATQDRPDDEKVGVKSLAVLLGDRVPIFLGFLGLLQVGFFAMTALRANMSFIFWVFGVAVWAVNMPWHVLSLDVKDRKSGGKIFKANILLGLYMTGVALVELLATRVNLLSMGHIGQRAGFVV